MVVWRRMKRRDGWILKAGAAIALLAMFAGCRSPWIQCAIANRQTTPVSLVQVTYPGGSFGVQTIAAGAVYQYRFHSLGTDKLSLDFTDAGRMNHTVAGPELRQNDEGSLRIEILPGNRVTWTPALTDRR